MLFAGYNDCPEGGWEDFRTSCDTKEEVIAFVKQHGYANKHFWAHIVDLTTGEQEYVR
jgi:hypothetical protein